MTLENIVTQLTKDAVKALYDIDCTDAQVQLQKTQDAEPHEAF